MSTKQRIYNYIHALVKHNNIPVMLTYQNIAVTLSVSELTVRRNLNILILEKHIYTNKLGNLCLYDIKPIDITKDFVCYIRNQVPKATTLS